MSCTVERLGERRDALLDTMLRLAASPRAAADLAERASELAGEDEEDLVGSLELVAALARDAARLASGRNEILHADAQGRIEELSAGLGAGRAAALVALAERLRSDLRVNANRTLVAETLLAAVAGALPAA